jgi:hypothetical protein
MRLNRSLKLGFGAASLLLSASVLADELPVTAETQTPSDLPQAPGPDETALPSSVEVAPRLPDLAAMLRAGRPTPHGADPALRVARGARWDNWGNARVRSTTTAGFALDNQQTTHREGTRYESRIVHGLSYAPSRRTMIHLEADILNGQFAGDTTDVGTSIGDDTFRERRNENWSLGIALPRKAYISILTNFALFQIGQQSFTWGTGFLANDGNGDPDFGDARQGSLVERASFVTAPWSRHAELSPWLRGLSFLGGVDVVFRDDNASLIDGDFAYGGVVGARIEHPLLTLGVFEAFRKQLDRVDPLYPEAGERTFVRSYATNVYARSRVWQNETQGLTIEGEAAFVAGQTDRPYFDETLRDGAKIRGFGTVLRARYDHDPAGFSARLEFGLASGDNDTRDDVARGFSFHSDYNVGLILFEQMMPLITARAIDRINDRGLIAVTPGSLRYAVNQGTVSNALYVYPVVRWRPDDIVDLRFAYLMARSSADFADTFQSALGGGYNTTPGGDAPGSRMLGHEFDFGARFTFNGAKLDGAATDGATTRPGVAERLGAEAGVFLPGAAFEGLQSDIVWTVRGHFDVIW